MKHGMKHEGAKKKSKGKGKPKNANHSKMEAFEKSMHGKNRGAGFKGYGISKGGM